MLCLHSSTLLVNMTPLLWFMALTSSSRLLRAPGFSVKMMHTSGIRCCCYTGTPTTAGQSWRNLWVDYLYPVALHLFLTVTNSSGECRPRVDTTLLQMTRAVVGDMQHSSKNLECRTQCSRGGGDDNNKKVSHHHCRWQQHTNNSRDYSQWSVCFVNLYSPFLSNTRLDLCLNTTYMLVFYFFLKTAAYSGELWQLPVKEVIHWSQRALSTWSF